MENKIMETWSQRVDRYIAEGRTVSGGCGPSKAMKDLNERTKSQAIAMQDEAKQIFGDTSDLFASLKGSLDPLIAGGPTQQGWGAAETNAVNAQIMEQAAINARNQKAAVGNAVAAIGGGNTVSPSGLETAVNLQTNQAVEEAKSKQLSQATVQNYETGRENYFKAVSGEMSLPNMFNPSIEANKGVTSALDAATKSQASIDKAGNWWQPLVMGAIGTGLDVASAGLGGTGLTDALSKGAEVGAGAFGK